MYHHRTGSYRGQHGDIHIPQHLDKIITGIFGFDTRPKWRHGHRQWVMAAGGAGGTNGEPVTYFAQHYNFLMTADSGAPLDGSGQTITIIELGGGYRTSDLAMYFQEIDVPLPSITAIQVGAGNQPTGDPGGPDGKVMLDIEVAGAVVPKAKFVIYFAANARDKGFLDMIRATVHDVQRKPNVISISWGNLEDSIDQQGLDAFHQLFTEAGALGITVCVASGDHGMADNIVPPWDGEIHIDHPAVDPLVLGCGGTQIEGEGNDVVWNQVGNDGSWWASGGGISQKFPVPGYQLGASLLVAINGGQPGHSVPDIAMSATNYLMHVNTLEGASGGTSAIAPLMAALVA